MAKISGNKHETEITQSSGVLSKRQRKNFEISSQTATFSSVLGAGDCGDYVVKFLDSAGNFLFGIEKKRFNGKSPYFEKVLCYLIPDHEKKEILYESIYHPTLIHSLIYGILHEKLVDVPYFLREDFLFMLDTFGCSDLRSRLNFLTRTKMWNGPSVAVMLEDRAQGVWKMPLEFYVRVGSLVEDECFAGPEDGFSGPEKTEEGYEVVIPRNDKYFHVSLWPFVKEIFYFTYHGETDDPRVTWALIRIATEETILALDRLGFYSYLESLKHTVASYTIISSFYLEGDAIDEVREMKDQDATDFLRWWINRTNNRGIVFARKNVYDWNKDGFLASRTVNDETFITSIRVEDTRAIPARYKNGFAAMLDLPLWVLWKILDNDGIVSLVVNFGEFLKRQQPSFMQRMPLPDIRTDASWDRQILGRCAPRLRFFLGGDILDVPLGCGARISELSVDFGSILE